MEYKKLGILGICSSLSLGLCDNVDAARRAAAGWRASDASRVQSIEVAAQNNANNVLRDIRDAADIAAMVAVPGANFGVGVTGDAAAVGRIRGADSIANMVLVPNANLNAGFTADATAVAGIRGADSIANMVAVPNANLNAGFTDDATAVGEIRGANSVAAMGALNAHGLHADFIADAAAVGRIRGADSIANMVAVPNANLNAGFTDDATAVGEIRGANSVAAMGALNVHGLHADFIADAEAVGRIRGAEGFAELATVPNAHLHDDLSYRLQFARALSTGDFGASLADDAWTVGSFGGGKLRNDRLAEFFKANYGKNAYNAGDLAGFDDCFNVAGAVIADPGNVAQVWGEVQYARGDVDETLAGLRAIGGNLNAGGNDGLAPIFDSLMEQLVMLSMQ